MFILAQEAIKAAEKTSEINQGDGGGLSQEKVWQLI